MTNQTDEHQTLIQHLTELRVRLMWTGAFILLGFFVAWGFSEYIFDFIRKPIEPHLKGPGGGLVFTAPMDKFLAHIKVSLLAGIIGSCPFWLYQVWRFVAPGLYEKEKRYGVVFILSGTVLFLSGVSFVYFVVFPMTFQFLMNFGGAADAPLITIAEYLSFFTTVTLVFGLMFELPLILSILGMMGIVDHHFLASKRKYAIVILAAMSAVVTPPDVISMFAMLVPLILLYELSVILVRFLGRQREAQ